MKALKPSVLLGPYSVSLVHAGEGIPILVVSLVLGTDGGDWICNSANELPCYQQLTSLHLCIFGHLCS